MPRIVNLEIYLNDKTLQDIIAAHLYAMSIIDHREEIVDLCIGDANEEGVRPVNFKLFKTNEVNLIVHK